MPAEFVCRLDGPATPLLHFWEHTIGSGHAQIALRVGGSATASNAWISELLLVDGAHLASDAWLPRGQSGITTLLTNHALPRHAIGPERLRVIRTGASEYPSAAQVDQLDRASRLVAEPIEWRCNAGAIRFDVELPPQSVAAVTLELTFEWPEGGHG